MQGLRHGLRRRRGQLAGRGHGDRGVWLLRLRRHLQLCVRLRHLRLLREVQCWREGRAGEAGRGQPAGELRRRGVQAGGVLHRRPRGRVVLLLALLLSGELSGLRGRRHSSCKTGTAPAALSLEPGASYTRHSSHPGACHRPVTQSHHTLQRGNFYYVTSNVRNEHTKKDRKALDPCKLASSRTGMVTSAPTAAATEEHAGARRRGARGQEGRGSLGESARLHRLSRWPYPSPRNHPDCAAATARVSAGCWAARPLCAQARSELEEPVLALGLTLSCRH